MAEAAAAFLTTLKPEQKQAAVMPFDDPERFNWDFVPRDRKGLAFRDLSTAQLQQAFGLIQSGLSHRGFFQTTTIMSLEEVLKELERGGGPVRDSQAYYLSIFGTPNRTNHWGWRIEGHHLSLNFTIAHGKVAVGAPNFFGSNPAEVKSGPRQGLRILAQEEDLGRQFAQSLTPEQRKTAIIAEVAYPDILVGKNREPRRLEPAGLSCAKLEPKQQAALKQLVSLYANRLRQELAERDLERIAKTGWDKVSFAWAGPLEKGKGHYYRVHGPTFILEYDNTQNQANHIHTVWRDYQNDFGDDLLKRHYEESDHHRAAK
jgi:hypothetical protein